MDTRVSGAQLVNVPEKQHANSVSQALSRPISKGDMLKMAQQLFHEASTMEDGAQFTLSRGAPLAQGNPMKMFGEIPGCATGQTRPSTVPLIPASGVGAQISLAPQHNQLHLMHLHAGRMPLPMSPMGTTSTTVGVKTSVYTMERVRLPTTQRSPLSWEQVLEMLQDTIYHGAGPRPQNIQLEGRATTILGMIFKEDLKKRRRSNSGSIRMDKWQFKGGKKIMTCPSCVDYRCHTDTTSRSQRFDQRGSSGENMGA